MVTVTAILWLGCGFVRVRVRDRVTQFFTEGAVRSRVRVRQSFTQGAVTKGAMRVRRSLCV